MADSWEGSKIDLEASWHWIDGSEFSLKVIAVMRPCDDTSGLVRGNRRKAVFAFKGLFSKGYLSRFRFGAVGFIAVFGSTGKSETSERNPIFTNKNRRAQMQDCGLVEGSPFFTALPEAFVSGMRQASEPLSATVFRVQESQVDALCHSGVIGMLFLLILFLPYLAAIVVLPQG